VTRILDTEIAVPAQCELAERSAWDAARGVTGRPPYLFDA
jgi:hypothetical protein